MRSSSRNLVSSLGAGILGVSYFIGSQTASNALDTNNTAAQATTAPTATATPTPSASASSSAAPSASSSKSSSSTSTKTTAPKPAASSSSSSSTSSTSTGSGSQSASVRYKYGTVSLKVTKKSGKITAISYSGSTATDGRAAAFPFLVDYAIADNGSNFTADQIANMSGATFTTNAFLSALDAALAKF